MMNPHRRIVASLCLVAFFGCWPAGSAAGAPDPTGPVQVVIDASQTRAPISPLIYGQFIEHIGGIINNNLWAEMLDDRKFYYPIVPLDPAEIRPEEPANPRRAALRHWTPVGPPESVTMDTAAPYVGEHSPRVELDGQQPRGIRQAGLHLVKDKKYLGHILLAGDPTAAATVSLVWGTAPAERQTVSIGKLSATYTSFPLQFTAPADSADAALETTATGKGSFHIGAISLMPADNVDGFRAEVIAVLRQLRSGIYRFPGGNFVSGHDWRDAIGPRDQRPPKMDYVWNAVQPNDVGTDEFLALCQLLDVEPYITVNAGFGDARSAAEYVEYANGAADSPMGKLRAAGGHPKPYGVKYWGVGNEMWGEWQFGVMPPRQFQIKHNLFARAMRRVDPSITLIASGAMPDTMTGSKQSLRLGKTLIPEYLSNEDFTGGMLTHCLDNLDMISEHFYSYNNQRFDLDKAESVPTDPAEPLIDWMRRPANHIRIKAEAYQEYVSRIPALKDKPVPIALSEWAYSRVPPNSYKVVPAYAWTFHEMFRHSDLYQMATFTFVTALMSESRTEAVLNPGGLVFKLYRDHFGTLPVAISGSSSQPPPNYPPGGEQPIVNAGSDTFPLDVAAAWTADRKSLTVAVINPTETEQELNLSITGANLAGPGHEWRMAPKDLNATIVVDQPPGVTVEESALDALPTSATFPPFSVTIYDFPAK
jgi:alpha-L-arabinofuranosidase